MTGTHAFVFARLGVGVVFAVAPAIALRAWLAAESVDRVAVALARGMGLRDIGLSVGALVALGSNRSRAGWLIGAAVAESVDAVVAALAPVSMSRRQRLVASLGPGVLAGLALALARRGSRRPRPAR